MKNPCSRNNPFHLQLEAAILRVGYKDTKDFIWKCIQNGMDFNDIHLYIEEEFNIKVHYQTILSTLRQLAPGNYIKGSMNFPKWRLMAKKRGYFSIKAMLVDYARQSMSTMEISKSFGTSYHVVKRLAKIYKVDLSVIHNEDGKLLGFTNPASYRKWLLKARKLGYNTVIELLQSLFEEGLSYREAAWRIGVEPQVLFNRCKQIDLKFKNSKEEEKENGIRSTG